MADERARKDRFAHINRAMCGANRDGDDCVNPDCPQKKDWKPICPLPDYDDLEEQTP